MVRRGAGRRRRPYVFYSGSAALFEEHRAALGAPADARYVGADTGFAALHDVALLSAMYGMFAGVAHAFALIREEPVAPGELAPLLGSWITAMSGSIARTATQLESGDYTGGVVSNLAMQVAGQDTLLRTAEEQGVSAELLAPYFRLMERRLEAGSGEEDLTGVVDLLRR
ncbi:3-hydroxyisobutyrate dehydrogenase-like beta-hydroxyacid dehydrogenase [Kitasatospora sp. MAA19]|nr:3-hydroxyisobutyrate dehydrogenase-like beta-hydroxyacid dehydrogenase [Kitasatospora sp. MAA19]